MENPELKTIMALTLVKDDATASLAKQRFRKAVKKVILKNRKEKALKAIKKAGIYLSDYQSRGPYDVGSRRGSTFAFQNDVRNCVFN